MARKPENPGEEDLISDFFTHVIWDVLNNVLFEIKSDVSLLELRDEIKILFLRRVRMEIDNEEFEKLVFQSIENHEIDPSLTGFFLNLLWQFLGKLNFYFQEYDNPDDAQRDLKEIVYEYLLVSYFENIVLKPVIKLVFINRNIHYGMIFGFKVKCNELFKAALDKSLSINEIKLSFNEEIATLDLPSIIVKSIEAILFSFFESLANMENIDEYVRNIKKILDQKKPLFKIEESSLIKSKGNISFLQRWFLQETLDWSLQAFKKLQIPLTFSISEARTKTLEAFTHLLQGNLTFESFSERIKNIFMISSTQDSEKYKHSLIADLNQPKSDIYNQTITSILALGEIVWDERQKDPTLWHFTQYVKEQELNRREMFIWFLRDR